ncbi:superoxide dismutase family protein [Pelagovum pacificum]|uniref:Superoxide dismutase family protein n=1 Tax=Pelagovum pacificum TaxID=2588711 RepID=A0A5C5GA69_9RHOB|nr:superoxide dismutase family protein [Pelagovum pacificum]QQA42532.1 superoxide dismutase family protein [Pelagovum pacificum]TNY31616.1 superoxide dismutase family protein [Pelagovum pacificum]
MFIRTATAIACLLPVAAFAAEADAPVTSVDGAELGIVQVIDTPSGVAHVIISLTGIPEGVHGIHLHETGDCSAEDFSSAGGHIAGDAEHGIMSENGPHPGDLPNATVQADGTLQAEYFLPDFSVEEWLADDDGAAFIVHAGSDDYESQPAGDAGDRFACGVFELQ